MIGSTLISHGHISVAPEEVPRKLSVDEIGGGVFERLFYGGGWVLFQGRCRCQKFKTIKLMRAGKLNRSMEKRLAGIIIMLSSFYKFTSQPYNNRIFQSWRTVWRRSAHMRC